MMAQHPLTEVKKDIYWVGAVDWDLRDFHGFSTPKGLSYNAFVLKGKEPVLIDTVKRPFADTYIEKIRSVVELKKIKHFIINHIEPDHSGSFPEIIKYLPETTLYASENAKIGLHRYYEFDRDIRVMKTGDTLDAGGRTFAFAETPMAHWPDSMITYMPEEKVLFSSDIFGQFIATSERFDDEIDPPYMDAAYYYANIILPFNHVVLKTLGLLPKLNVAPELVLPDHGIFWRKHIGDIIKHYQSWASGACADGILILYDSMWGSTEKMANMLYGSLVSKGLKVRKLHIRSNPLGRLVMEIMFSKVILIGTPTINNTLFPSVGQLLIYLQGLNPGPGREWSTFGSYGWGGGGVEYVRRWLKENQYRIIHPPVEAQFRPNADTQKALKSFAAAVAKRFK
jgi:flavorubredoxin